MLDLQVQTLIDLLKITNGFSQGLPKSSFSFCSFKIPFSSLSVSFRKVSFIIYKFKGSAGFGAYIFTLGMFF